MQRKRIDVDWITTVLFITLVVAGWMTIYAVSSLDGDGLFDGATNHGKQFMWMGISAVAAILILSLDNRFLEEISYIAYGASVLLLLSVFFIGTEVNGATSWLSVGGIRIQPAEFAKVTTAMALAKYMSSMNFNMSNLRHLLIAALMVIIPPIIIILQNDTGSALVFGSFIIMFYREGLSPLIPVMILLLAFVGLLTLGLGNQLIVISVLVGLAIFSFAIFYNKRIVSKLISAHVLALGFFIMVSFGTDLFVNRVLAEHQKTRIMVLFDPEIDPRGSGYNIIQSKIAIGSGGLIGKGFLEGNYTKAKFVPMQVTDFIFCTIGEEHGWMGSSFIILVFFALLWRVKFISENSKTRYTRIYGYGVISIIFFHLLINVGMTIGLVPVIGIPLPMFSYGGSSLLSFTILVFILINHYSYRINILGSKY